MAGLKAEDYLEPTCPLCNPAEAKRVTPVDLRRCIEKLDAILARNDYAAARRHLDYWRQEAMAGNDARGQLTIENERMGLFRKLGDEAAAREAMETAQALVERAGLEDTVTAGTTWLNIATVHKSFGRPELALPLYEKARAIYERELEPEDPRLGGLYNNMGLALVDLGRFAQARALYEKALTIMVGQPFGALEMAVTEENLASLEEAELGLLEGEEAIEAHLDRAWAYLHQPELPRNGYYAFVCEKSAPTFDYYGRFLDARELIRTAEELYDRT